MVVVAIGWVGARARRNRATAWRGHAAAAVGSAIRALVVAVMAVRGLVALGLISYGAWLAYEPAGYVVAGLLLLADRMLDERKEPRADG